MQRVIYALSFILMTLSLFGQDCPDEILSSVCFNLDECHSTFSSSSQSDYSEFTGVVDNGAEGSFFSVVGDHLYVNDPNTNTHSCTIGNNGTPAMCISSSDACVFVDDADKAVRFDIEVTPGVDGTGSISCLSFYEAAPQTFSWINGTSGLNDYPQYYGIRVTVNGEEVYKEVGIPTSNDWSLENFDFKDIPEFTVSTSTIFSFELLGYCTVGNGGFVNAWDLEDIKVYDKGPNPIYGGEITFDNGDTDLSICDDQDFVFTEVINNNGPNSVWVVTDNNGNIISVSSNPIDVSMYVPGMYTIQHMSYEDFECQSQSVNTDLEVVNIGSVELDLEDAECSAIAAYFVNPVPPTGTFDLPYKEFEVNITEGGYYTFNPSNSCDYVFNLYQTNGFDISQPCSTTNLLAFGGYSETNGGIEQVGGAYLEPGQYQMIICSINFGCTDAIVNGAVGITCSNIAPGMNVDEIAGCYSLSNTIKLTIVDSPVISINNIHITSCGFDNGSATAIANGGQGSYTYTWSNGATESMISDVAAGNYSVTVTDELGCTDEVIVSIGGSTSPVLSLNSVNTTCDLPNGSATAGSSDGSGNYTYVWSTGGTGSVISDLTPGTYSVTVTDGVGCTDVGSITVGSSTNPVVTVIKNDTTCGNDNGYSEASATGGAGNYSYSWSNGDMDSAITNVSAGTYTVTVTDSEGCTDVETVTIGGSSSPVISVSGVDTTCGESNGSASVTSTSGTGSYSYEWSTGSIGSSVSGLSAGTYTVTVTDGSGCIDEGSVTIEGSSSPVASVSGVATTCGESNGSASVTVSGGTGTYSYAWSNGSTGSSINDLAAGTYSVIVTDAVGCTDELSVTISGSSSPVVSVIKNDTTCGNDNGYAEASATGGSGGYSYSWSNGDMDSAITNASAGTYTVTVTDSEGCTDVETVTIGGSSSPVISVSGIDTTCGESNGSASATSTSGTGSYSYEWSTGFTGSSVSGLTAGTYTVTVTDGSGCIDEGSVTIGGSSSPVASVSGVATTCGESNGSVSVTASGGTGTYSYAWSNGSTGSSINDLSAGTYSVIVTDAVGCTDEGSVTISGSSSPVVSVIKNDTTCGNDNGYAEASATGGSGGYSYAWSNGDMDSAITNVSAGTYTVTVTDSEGCTDVETVILNNTIIPTEGGDVTFETGLTEMTICGDPGLVFMELENEIGTNSSWVVTDLNGNILDVSANPIDVSGLAVGSYNIYHISYEDFGCSNQSVDTDQNVINSSAVVLDLEDSDCAGIAAFFVNPVPPTGTVDLPFKEFTISISEAGFYNFNPSASCDYVFNLYPLNGFDTSMPCSTANLLAFGGYSETNGGIEQIGGAYLTPGDYQLIVCSIDFGCTDTILNGAIEITCTDLSPGINIGQLTGCYGLSNPAVLNINDSPSLTNAGMSGVTGLSTTCGLENGTANAVATGGSGTYTYEWSNGSTGSSIADLGSGTYTVTVTDGSGCTDEGSVTIGGSSSPEVSVIKNDTTCGNDNGYAEASAIGGSGTYTYEWSNGDMDSAITNATAGTYTVTVTDSNGCTVVENVTINSSNSPVLSVSGVATTCGESNGSASANTVNGAGTYTYEWSNGSTGSSVSDLSSGTYTVTVTDAAGCTDEESVIIGGSTNPVASVNGVDATCGLENGTANAVATGGSGTYTYEWSNGSTGSSISDLSAGTYSVIVTDGAGCTDEGSVTIGGSSSPVVSVIKNDTTCGNDNGYAEASATGGSGGYSYLWSNGDMDSAITNATAGTYTVTVTDSNGCTDVENVTINSSNSPVLSVSGVATTCGESNGSASANTVNGAGTYTYEWSNGSTGSSVSDLSSGTYTVTVTDAAGCTDEESVIIGGSTNPVASVNGVDTTCGLENGTANAVATGGSGTYTYEWSNGSTGPSISDLSAGTYSVIVTDGAGCTDEGSVTIGGSSSPVVSVIKNDTTCGNDNGYAEASATGGSGGYSYLWSNGDMDSAITNASAGTYTVTVTDSNGCTVVENVTIDSSNSPVLSVSGVTTTCGESDGSASANTVNGSGAYTYEWSNGSTDSSVSDLSAGTYTVTVTDAAGCTDEESVTIGGSSSPVVSVSGIDTTCGESNGSASASVTGGSGTYTYEWSNGSTGSSISNVSGGNYTVTVTDGGACTAVGSVTIGDSSGTTVSISYNDTSCGLNNGYAQATAMGGSGTYLYAWNIGNIDNEITNAPAGTYTVTVSDALGCTAVESVTIGDSTSPVLSVSGMDTTCGESNGSASASTTSGSGLYTYLWSNGSAGSSINNLTAGTYTVTVTDEVGCIDEESVTINDSSSPIVMLSGVDALCGESNGSVSTSTTSGSGTYTYEWSNGSTDSSISDLGAGTYSVTVTDSAGCTDQGSVTIDATNSPIVLVTGTSTSCGLSNGYAEASTTGGSGTYTYLWSNGDVDSAITNVGSGTYTVTVTDEAGCTDVESIAIGSSNNPSISISGVNTSCGLNNGSATASTANGTGSYSYSWSTGSTGSSISDLSSGTYTVTVTDGAGCTDEGSVTIDASSSPVITINGVNTTCGESDGSASSSTISGTGTYTYVWSTGSTSSSISNLDAGTYTVTVTDEAGCTDEGIVIINNSSSPVLSVDISTDTSCGLTNGYAEVNTTEGSGGYTYLWSNGDMDSAITNVSAGTYTVTVTDSQGCTDEASVTIGASSNLAIDISGVNEICTDGLGSASVTVSSGNGSYVYVWSNGASTSSISSLSAGTYGVTVTDDHGCTADQSITLNNETSLVVEASGTNTCCAIDNGTATVNVECPFGTYTINWSNGETTEDINNLAPGSYTVTVTDSAGNTGTDVVVVDSSTAPVVEISHTNTICGQNDGSAQATASSGTPGYTYEWNTGDTTSSIDGLSGGTYTVTVTDAKDCVVIETVTIDGSVNPNAGNLTGGPFHFCIDGIEDNVSDINVTGVVGTNTTYLITNENGIILGLPSSLSDLENVNFESAGTGTCYIYHVAYESGVTGLTVGASINSINGCYDIDGSIEVVREGITSVTPTLSFDMDACNAGTTFGEFTSSIVNYNGCTALGVVGGNLTAGFSHSCTPGVSNNGMCFTANLSCTYNPSTTQKMIIPISVIPGADGTGNLSGISFYEQAPQTFVWTDGNSGVNNYPTLYSIRVLKDGVMVYEIADNSTNFGWTQANFSFLSNPEFTVTEPTTFTIELIPYCAAGNSSTTISIWDIDEVEIYSQCDVTPAAGSLNGGPYDICIDGLADYITDISLTGAAGINSSFIITDASGNIIGLPATMSDLSAVNFDDAGVGTCYIYHVSYDSGMIGLTMGNNVFEDLYGCYDLSNSIEVVRNECGSIMDIYPNPTNGQLTIDLRTRTFDQVSYSIIDNLGRVVSTTRISGNKSRKIEIDLSNMQAGQYYIQSTVDGFRRTMPIVIVK